MNSEEKKKIEEELNAVNLLLDHCDDNGLLNITPNDINTKSVDKISVALKNLDIVLASNGVMFKKDKDGILPVIMENIYAERKAIKKKMLDAEQKVADSKKGTDEHSKYKNEHSKYKTFQLGAKVFLNSAYGMLGNEYSRYYDVRIAEAITLSGQLSIQWIAKRLNNKLNDLYKTTDNDYIIAGDSVLGDTKIYVNNKSIKIEDYFNMMDYKVGEKEYKCVNDKTLTIDENLNIVEDTIVKVMKHDIEKEIFEITLDNGMSVSVTEDHSLMVYRNNKLVEVKPTEVLQNDVILYVEE